MRERDVGIKKTEAGKTREVRERYKPEHGQAWGREKQRQADRKEREKLRDREG